jgi:hypothetical protein
MGHGLLSQSKYTDPKSPKEQGSLGKVNSGKSIINSFVKSDSYRYKNKIL